jgi:peptidyl-prolyl cis-trans isomerase SurA
MRLDMGYGNQVTTRTGAMRLLGLAAAAAIAASAFAQTTPSDQSTGDQAVPDNQVPDTNLNIPANLQIFGKLDPNIRKPTAIVNDTVITGTDVDQRVALIMSANQVQLSAADLERLKLQVLRQLIDETLQIQEAKAHDITVTNDEITQGYDRVAHNFNKSDTDLGKYLRQQGSSERSLKRQIEGELAWSRYLRRRVEPFVNVGDEEVKAILDRLERDKGTPEFHLKEIFMAGANPAGIQQVMEQIKSQKAPFEYYAKNYSESPTKQVGGDLDFVRASTLPAPLAQAAEEMQVGQVAGPIENSGGYSIL